MELELGQRVSARLTAALAKELDRRSKEALLGKGTEWRNSKVENGWSNLISLGGLTRAQEDG